MKKKNKVGQNISARNSSWTFGGKVSKDFDNHIDKSVPLYKWTHELGLNFSDFFIKDKSMVYDLGCSTGTFVKKLSQRHSNKNFFIKGFDVEKNMVKTAKKNNSKIKNKILCADINKIKFQKIDFITSYYTLQFVNPSKRQEIFDKIFKGLNWGGGFLFFEKVRAPDARFQDMMSLMYNEFKLENNFNADEIIAKSRSLKGVMEPFSSNANRDLCKRAGFRDIITVFKFICFEGFLAIK